MGEVEFVVLVDFKYFVCDPDDADSQILNSYRFVCDPDDTDNQILKSS